MVSSPRFTVREIAARAGVSDATADRVLHNRGGVRATTAAAVRRAIVELERDHEAFELGGRTFTIDLVMHSPQRFSSAVWSAFEAVVPTLRPAVFRVRPQTHERISVDALVGSLEAIAKRGSHAVVVKAPDVPEINVAVDELVAADIPVITIVTDLPSSRRLAYVGIDNRAAGATAAYLVDRWLGDTEGGVPTVLLTMSDHRFRGEEEREIGFRATARSLDRQWNLTDLAETEGLDATIARQLEALGAEHVDAVYSMGGGNTGILDVLARRGIEPSVFVAHDLDEDNVRLLDDGRVSAVLHHDLATDARRVCQLVMQAHRAVPGNPATERAPVQIITPFNRP